MYHQCIFHDDNKENSTGNSKGYSLWHSIRRLANNLRRVLSRIGPSVRAVWTVFPLICFDTSHVAVQHATEQHTEYNADSAVRIYPISSTSTDIRVFWFKKRKMKSTYTTTYKNKRMTVVKNTLERFNSDPIFIKHIDMQTSQQASKWRLPTHPKPKIGRSKLGWPQKTIWFFLSN